MERVGGCQHRHSFEQIRLALGIVPVKEKQARLQRNFLLLEITKVSQREVRKIHAKTR